MARRRPQKGDYVQRIDRNSNVHVVEAIQHTDSGTLLKMQCGNGWPSGVLNLVGENEAHQRPCSGCVTA